MRQFPLSVELWHGDRFYKPIFVRLTGEAHAAVMLSYVMEEMRGREKLVRVMSDRKVNQHTGLSQAEIVLAIRRLTKLPFLYVTRIKSAQHNKTRFEVDWKQYLKAMKAFAKAQGRKW